MPLYFVAFYLEELPSARFLLGTGDNWADIAWQIGSLVEFPNCVLQNLVPNHHGHPV